FEHDMSTYTVLLQVVKEIADVAVVKRVAWVPVCARVCASQCLSECGIRSESERQREYQDKRSKAHARCASPRRALQRTPQFKPLRYVDRTSIATLVPDVRARGEHAARPSRQAYGRCSHRPRITQKARATRMSPLRAMLASPSILAKGEGDVNV